MKLVITKIFLIFSLSFLNNTNRIDDGKITHVIYKLARFSEAKVGSNDLAKKINNSYGDKGLTDGKINEIKDVIQKANEIKYSIELDLFYNNNESLYFSEQKLSIKNSLEEEFARITVGANLIRYKNNTKREKFYQIDESGQKFNVILNFDEYKWEITTESKIINGYKCFKAISYKEEFDKIRNRKNVFHPVVWFTPEIPSSFGPEGFDGLPGLVLEASRNGRAFLFATKIEFDYKGTIQIRKPQKGKDVTEIEYLQIIADLFPKN